MRNKLIGGLVAAAVMFTATPLWAKGGHGHGHEKHGHGHKHHVHKHFHDSHFVVRERWYPEPVYAAPVYVPVYAAPVYRAPAPGVHVVLPNIFVPLP
jgi:hypothetical protein